MRFTDFLRRRVPRRIVRERTALRVTPYNLGHGLTYARLRCDKCGHAWVEVAAPYVVVQDCPACHAALRFAMPNVEPPDLGSDGPWLTGEFDTLLDLAARQHKGL